MGLFTNRKRDDEDLEGLSEAANMLAHLNAPAEFEGASFDTVEAAANPGTPLASFFPAQPLGDDASAEQVNGIAAAPIADVTAFAPIGATAPEAAVPTPRRRLQDRPRAQAGNVEIDATGLLGLLGVETDATLIDISEAHQRFLADHEPSDSDDADAAGIKEKIRCEVNTAYASFRLTRAA